VVTSVVEVEERTVDVEGDASVVTLVVCGEGRAVDAGDEVV